MGEEDLAILCPSCPDFNWGCCGQETRAHAQFYFSHSEPQSLLLALGTSWGGFEGSQALGNQFYPTAPHTLTYPKYSVSCLTEPQLESKRGVTWSVSPSKLGWP